MSGGAAAQTMRASAVRINHRWKRFAGANALKKIALNVIAKVRRVDNASRCVVFLTGRSSESAFVLRPGQLVGEGTPGCWHHGWEAITQRPVRRFSYIVRDVNNSFNPPRKWLLAFNKRKLRSIILVRLKKQV